MNKNLLITNNPMVAELIKSNKLDVLFLSDISYFDVLSKVRDLVHIGHRLLTHPTVSSIKPNEMPYKTVVLTGKEDKVDLESISLIEEAIGLSNCFIDKPKRTLTKQIDYDFKMIDYNLINAAITSIL